MSPRLAGSSPKRLLQQHPEAHATASESIGTSGDSGFEIESLLPFGRNTSGATYTYTESSESLSDPPEDTPDPALFVSTPSYQVSFDSTGAASALQHYP